MIPLRYTALALGGAWAMSGGLLLGAGAASAGSVLTVRPGSVAAGDTVTVKGACPAATNGAYVRATVGVEALDRYVVVPVAEDGAFRARVPVEPAGTAEDPEPGDRLAVDVSCATAASFVSRVGTKAVTVVSEAEAAALAAARGSVGATTTSGDGSVARAVTDLSTGTSSGDDPVPGTVPLIAFLVAAVGTIAAFLLSRRSDARADAMATHPAQRGLGRAPRRARR